MNMGIGFSEILLIFVVLLLLFGSKEMPKFIKEITRLVAKVRQYGNQVKQEIDTVTRELDIHEPMIPPADSQVSIQKKELRTKYISARKQLSPEERLEKSKTITSFLKETVQYKNAGAVMVYLNMGAEVETRDLINDMLKEGKRVVLPYCIPASRNLGIGEVTDLESDTILSENKALEPKPEVRDKFFRSDLQLIIAPGVAFDIYGDRLGRGMAYYDNFLKELKGKVPVFGLAFDCQIQETALPFDYGDIAVDQVLSERGPRLPYGSENSLSTIELPGEPDMSSNI